MHSGLRALPRAPGTAITDPREPIGTCDEEEEMKIDNGLQARIGGLTVSKARELGEDPWRLVAAKRLAAAFYRSGAK